jgi:hypothetical protein
MEIRSGEYMHWWTFLSYFFEIGDCLFAQVVRIRDKLARNKKLEKAERDWLKHNRHLVDIQPRYTKQDEQLLEEWGLK